MTGPARPLPPRPPDPNAVGAQLLGALTGKILGNLSDAEKAEILENVEASNKELLHAIQSLDESVNALGTLLNLWTRIMVEWSTSGGKSVASLQSVIRDVTSEAAEEAEEEEEEEEEEDESDEADDEAEGPTIEGRVRQVDQ